MMIFWMDDFTNSTLTVHEASDLGQHGVRRQVRLYMNVTIHLRLA